MSVKENGEYTTYSNLEPVRDALKKAALESGCAFWDMYEAMGGRNSMPSWVFADPPLAISDFVHFNPRGARIIGEMFYNAFIYEYDQWLETYIHLCRKPMIIENRPGLTNRILIDLKEIFLYDPEKPLLFTQMYFWVFLPSSWQYTP